MLWILFLKSSVDKYSLKGSIFMGLNDTPSGERIHIGFFGRRNAGKSSVVNAVTGQELAVVSDTKGTTTDPVSKAMELLPLGPVMIIDTPGFDDKGHLGELRVRKTKQILNRTDIAVLVIDSTQGVKQCEEELLAIFKEKEIPYLLVYNKEDILSEEQKNLLRTEQSEQVNSICVSALEKKHINLKKKRKNVGKISWNMHPGETLNRTLYTENFGRI